VSTRGTFDNPRRRRRNIPTMHNPKITGWARVQSLPRKIYFKTVIAPGESVREARVDPADPKEPRFECGITSVAAMTFDTDELTERSNPKNQYAGRTMPERTNNLNARRIGDVSVDLSVEIIRNLNIKTIAK
jgi:hypothetical protein